MQGMRLKGLRVCKLSKSEKGLTAWRRRQGGGKMCSDSENSLANGNYLHQFMCAFPCLPAPPRPNISTKFRLVDASRPPLLDSLSPLICRLRVLRDGQICMIVAMVFLVSGF